MYSLWSLRGGAGCVKNKWCVPNRFRVGEAVIVSKGGGARCCCSAGALSRGSAASPPPPARQHRGTWLLIGACRTVSQAPSAPGNEAQH